MADHPVRLHADLRATIDVAADPTARQRLRHETTQLVADLCGSPPAVELTSSCTHALEATAMALGLGHGDEVLVPAFAFPSAANAFLLGGASIRFADVEPTTGNIDIDDVERRLTPRTRAVVVLHYGGVAADLDRLVPLVHEAGVSLIEDAAHSLFGSYRGTPLGRFGAAGCISFHRTKNISCLDGGALILNDPDLVRNAQIALDKGTNRVEFEHRHVTSYDWSGPGTSGRLSDGLVGLLAAELARSEQIQVRRHEIWSRYHDELDAWADRTGTLLPTVPRDANHPAHLYWLLLPKGADRTQFVARCAERDVELARHYGSLPQSPFGARFGDPGDRYPGAHVLAEQLVRLPIHDQLDDDDVDRVIAAVTG